MVSGNYPLPSPILVGAVEEVALRVPPKAYRGPRAAPRCCLKVVLVWQRYLWVFLQERLIHPNWELFLVLTSLPVNLEREVAPGHYPWLRDWVDELGVA